MNGKEIQKKVKYISNRTNSNIMGWGRDEIRESIIILFDDVCVYGSQ